MMYYYYLQVCNGIFLEGKTYSLEGWQELSRTEKFQTLRGKKLNSNIVVYTIYLENHDDDGVLEEVKQTIL